MTKATLKRLNKHGTYTKDENGILVEGEYYIDRICVIAEILIRCGAIYGDTSKGRFEIGPNPGDENGFSSTVYGEYERKCVRGMHSRYPNLVSVTLTHGLNGVDIKDPDKLVRAILKEYA